MAAGISAWLSLLGLISSRFFGTSTGTEPCRRCSLTWEQREFPLFRSQIWSLHTSQPLSMGSILNTDINNIHGTLASTVILTLSCYTKASCWIKTWTNRPLQARGIKTPLLNTDELTQDSQRPTKDLIDKLVPRFQLCYHEPHTWTATSKGLLLYFTLKTHSTPFPHLLTDWVALGNYPYPPLGATSIGTRTRFWLKMG